MNNTLRAGKSYFFLLCFFCGFAKAQVRTGFSGREFWVTFMENASTPVDTALQLLVSPQRKDTVRLFNPQTGYTKDFEVRPGQQNTITISAAQWYSKKQALPQNTGIRVRSLGADVAVQAVNAIFSSADVTSLLPSPNLENARKYAINTNAANSFASGQAAVLAIDTGTTIVEILAGADIAGLGGKGNTYTKSLKFGQVYLIEALDTQNLSGTIITVNGCKRIAVFAGAKCARIQNAVQCLGCDVLYEQMWPTQLADTGFYIPNVPGNNQYRLGITALYNNTLVTANGVTYGPFNAGGNFQREFSVPALVTADKPVVCAQILKSSGCNGAANPLSGDPSLVNIAGIGNSTTKSYTSCVRNFNYTHTLAIVATTYGKPVVKVNNVAMPAMAFQKFLIGSRSFWFGYTTITPNNTYEVVSDSGFYAYQYGIGNSESYATCVGASFANRNADFVYQPHPICDPATAVQFSAFGDSLNAITWQYGDGNTGSGNSTSNIYGKAGTYKVKMINRTSASCPDTITKILNVLNGPPAMLPIDSHPCLGAILRVELPSNNNYSYLWDNGSTSFVQSFIADRKAVLTTSDNQGCVRKDTMEVKFKDCDSFDLKLANVFTPGTDGKNDVWKVYFTGYDKVEVGIFNRWGELIYGYTLPKDSDWNGKVNNQFTPCPSGVYFYRLIASSSRKGIEKSVSGMIHLLRE